MAKTKRPDLRKNKNALKCLELDLQGYSIPQIAKILGLTYTCIAHYKNNPSYLEMRQEMLESAIKEAKDQLKYGTSFAVSRLLELTHSESERVALAACTTLLDRIMGKATETVEIKSVERPLEKVSDEQLKKLIENE